MSNLLSFMDSLWLLMWYPLRNLSFDTVVVTCPLLFLILAFVYGLMIKFVRGVVR